MKEIVLISGKGGTGKTSLAACFASFGEKKMIADCDVDAADLHLVLEPTIRRRQQFTGGKKARVKSEVCAGCGTCKEVCRFDAVSEIQASDSARVIYRIDVISCEGCGVCHYLCPERAVEFEDRIGGEWYISETRYGPMVHAKLGIAQENSGKLVTIVRNQARTVAEELGLDTILVDGSPGIGCPVIASITGTDLVVMVTEPTLSAEHDLKRASQLANHFSVPAVVCINKCDINRDVSSRIEEWCIREEKPVLSKIPFDGDFTRAQVKGKTLVEYSNGETAREVRLLWRRILEKLEERKEDRISVGPNKREEGTGG